MENISMENTENTKENIEEKRYDILYPTTLNNIIFEKEKYKYSIVFFKQLKTEIEISEIAEIINQDLDFQEIQIINIEDNITIIVFTNTTRIDQYILKGFSIGKYFYNLTDHEYSEITSKYIDLNSIVSKRY